MRSTFIAGCLIMIAGVARAQTASSVSAPTNYVPSSEAINEARSFGVGPLFGEPTGLGAKLWLTDILALDGGLGWSFVHPDGFQLHGDFLFHKFDLFRGVERELPLYFGVGGRVKFVEHGDDRAGFRLPFGVSYLMNDQHLEFFAEVAPIIDFTPHTRLEWNGGVGIRFYFN